MDCIHQEVICPSPAAALAVLHEPVARWLQDQFTTPTPIQRLAWPAIARGDHTLLVAPTGTGKTLAAVLPVLGELLREPAAAGSVRCLYLAPLKALCNDMRRTLHWALEQLRPFLAPGRDLPHVALRSGDTSAAARRSLLRNPPDVLLTTPESLALLLTQRAGLALLSGVRWVIVDEVHALAANKRGADLSLSLERVQELADRPPQRIGLSATCTPAREAARFLAGTYRPCTICQVGESARTEIVIEPLAHLPDGEADNPQRFFRQLLGRLEREITPDRTTLIFTNTRSLAERLTWALRRRYPELAEQTAVHHSALDARRRRQVEGQLKRGQLRVVVTSTSLELGIDIGSVDNVVLIHPPGDVSRLLQRIGRAGHGPGRPRRGLVLTSHAARLLEAAVTAVAGQSCQLETLHAPEHPLDVLCQQLLGMASVQVREPDQVYRLVRGAYPYRELPRADFDRCLDYLSGRDGSGRPWLPPRLDWFDERFGVRDARTLRILRQNVGTILSEEALDVRLPDRTRIGELDSGFAEHLQPGDRFLLDGRCLQFVRSTAHAVVAEEVTGQPRVPRWQGTGWPLSRELAERLFVLRARAGEVLAAGPDALARLLAEDYQLTPACVEVLVTFFRNQESLSEIPDPATCLIEVVNTGSGLDYYFHNHLNRAANDALARVLSRRLNRSGRRAAVLLVADLGFLISLESFDEVGADKWRLLQSPTGFAADLDEEVASSGLLNQRFCQVAYTGLMLLRNPIGGPPQVGGRDWAERRLFQQVQTRDRDFVLLRQARREIEHELLDAPAAVRYLEEMPLRSIRLRWLPAISPFAEGWTQVVASAEEVIGDPTAVLERLHAALTGKATD